MEKITVLTLVKSDKDKVWDYWNGLDHISNWAHANDEWGALGLKNDLQNGGKFKTRMFAKDNSVAFDFEGTYTNIIPEELIEYYLDDGRQVTITFMETPDGILITETFDSDNENSIDMQKTGWQAILDNFKNYVERN